LRILISLILALATLLPCLAQAYDVLLLVSRRDQASEEVIKGFHSACPAAPRILYLSDYAEVDLTRILREENPRLILTLGDAALKGARRVSRTPVISVMALGIHGQAAQQPNLTGIEMFASPESYLALFRKLKVSRVGVVYDDARSGWYLRLARQAAENAGITLVTREIDSPREAPEKIASLAGKVDALWMLPDTTAVTRESSEAYFRFGQSQKVPVVSFSASYLGLGAGAVVEIDRTELGRQACDMVDDFLKKGRVSGMPPGFPRGTQVKTNPEVLRRLTSSVTSSSRFALSSLFGE
jgi:putative ABC transport system substrate-binding protein